MAAPKPARPVFPPADRALDTLWSLLAEQSVATGNVRYNCPVVIWQGSARTHAILATDPVQERSAREVEDPEMGEMIEFAANGGTCPGYLVQAKSDVAPGVVVIQEWWGLNASKSDIKDIAERLAQAGYTALAPDLYHGEAAEEPDEAGKLMMSLRIEQASQDLRGAIEYLRELTGKPVGIMGFCMGGALALYAACENPEGVAACVDFYGGYPKITPDLAGLRAPLLGLFGELDRGVNAEYVQRLDEELTTLGKAHEFTIYPGAQHAFFNQLRPESYNAEAATDAWNQVLGWFGQYLGFTEEQLNSDEQLQAAIDTEDES